VIERADRVALVGVNGAGKSTLIKILAGAESLTSGEYILGHNAQPDYFAQDQYKELDPAARMIDDLSTIAPRATNTELRSILGCFLFSEDDVFKPIGVLSGGERNRYALARMLMMPSNFLLLDEPTNHLDMRAKDVLLTALEEYSGTVVFVSHDRYFIDKLATRILEVENGRVNVFPGNYEDYVWRKGGGQAAAQAPPELEPGTRKDTIAAPEQTRAEAGRRARPNPGAESARHARLNPPPEAAGPPRLNPPPEAARHARLNPIKLRQMKERRREIEDEVTRLEVEITDYEGALRSFVNVEETRRLGGLLAARRADLQELLREWEEVAQAIEANK
jgi:ATP-binding cassette, subfamily F, member 3